MLRRTGIAAMMTSVVWLSIASARNDRSPLPPGVRVIDLGEQALFVHCAFRDLRTGFICGGNSEQGTPASLMRTDDAGETWHRMESGVASRLYDSTWPTKEVGVASGFAGCLIRTDDGGQNWRTLPPLDKAWVAAVHLIEGARGFIAGARNGMLLARTADGGGTWDSIVDRVPEDARSIDLRALHFVNDSTGVACGSAGLIIRTIDGGDTWQRCTSTDDVTWLKSISFPTATTGYVAGTHSAVLRTDDSGATWRKVPVPGSFKLNGIAFISPDRGIAAAADGTLLYTTDGAATWHVLQSTGYALTSAAAAPNGVIWVTTERGVLLRIEWPA